MEGTLRLLVTNELEQMGRSWQSQVQSSHPGRVPVRPSPRASVRRSESAVEVLNTFLKSSVPFGRIKRGRGTCISERGPKRYRRKGYGVFAFRMVPSRPSFNK